MKDGLTLADVQRVAAMLTAPSTSPFATTIYKNRIHWSWFETLEQRQWIAAMLERADELDRG